jgi:two-component system, cell cycle response regulator DivK
VDQEPSRLQLPRNRRRQLALGVPRSVFADLPIAVASSLFYAEPTMEKKQPSILLVDDFEDGLEMYREYLTFRGHRVIVARNGEDAIAQAHAHRPDVVLLDIRMPGMTGTQAMQVLRSDPSFERVPIIALTAHALDGERASALAAGFDDLIAKPCLPNELADAVELILSGTRPSHA